MHVKKILNFLSIVLFAAKLCASEESAQNTSITRAAKRRHQGVAALQNNHNDGQDDKAKLVAALAKIEMLKQQIAESTKRSCPAECCIKAAREQAEAAAEKAIRDAMTPEELAAEAQALAEQEKRELLLRIEHNMYCPSEYAYPINPNIFLKHFSKEAFRQYFGAKPENYFTLPAHHSTSDLAD